MLGRQKKGKLLTYLEGPPQVAVRFRCFCCCITLKLALKPLHGVNLGEFHPQGILDLFLFFVIFYFVPRASWPLQPTIWENIFGTFSKHQTGKSECRPTPSPVTNSKSTLNIDSVGTWLSFFRWIPPSGMEWISIPKKLLESLVIQSSKRQLRWLVSRGLDHHPTAYLFPPGNSRPD